jgi:hypothetical protein
MTPLICVLAIIVSLVAQTRPAFAWQTATVCDPPGVGVSKYWCYTAFAEPYSAGLTITCRLHEGKLGDGGAVWWRRSATQDWRYNGSWTFLGSFGQGPLHTTNNWESESVTTPRYIDNDAVIRMQNQYKSTGQGTVYCDPYVDFHMSSTYGSYSSLGPAGCI